MIVIKIDALVTPAPLERIFSSRVLDQDASHRLRSRRDEMAAVFPSIRRALQQPQVGVMNERGRLQRMSRVLLRHLRSRDSLKLVIHQRQKLRGSVRIAVAHRLHQLRGLGHDLPAYLISLK
jgi:hypothetical protein